jgi:hypothetical protein
MYYLILSLTSLLMLLPLVYLKQKREKKIVLNFSHPIHYLELLLICTLIISFMHWMNPNKLRDSEYSFLSIIDGYLAKLSAILVAIYIFSIKKINLIYKLSALLLGATAITAFYYSNKESQIEWCSDKHIAYHIIFHIHCIFIIYIAFS